MTSAQKKQKHLVYPFHILKTNGKLAFKSQIALRHDLTKKNTGDCKGLAVLWAKSNGVSLKGTELIRANLNGMDLTAVDFEDAVLIGAYCVGTNFERANFTYANLAVADIRDANLNGACLRGTKLKNTRMPYGKTYNSQVSLAVQLKAQREYPSLRQVL